MRKLLVLLCALTAMPLVANADVVVTKIERWTIVEYGNVAKALPPGYHDFRPVSAQFASNTNTSDKMVICETMGGAISFGKRLGLDYMPDEAVEEISQLNGGKVPCGYRAGLVLTPLEFAIRGDDADQRISIIKFEDQDGRFYYVGAPVTN